MVQADLLATDQVAEIMVQECPAIIRERPAMVRERLVMVRELVGRATADQVAEAMVVQELLITVIYS